MPEKKYTLYEDELKDLKAQVAAIQVFINNGENIEEIKKRANILVYLLNKIENKEIKPIIQNP